MPNHIINEIIIRDLTWRRAAEIKAGIFNAEGKVDFRILLPPPLNLWMGSVGERHEQAFPGTMLGWATENWGTKWNAYDGDPVVEEATGDFVTLTFHFQTAWAPPYGWLVALFNRFEVSFDHNWRDEGGDGGTAGRFDYAKFGEPFALDAWAEVPASPELSRHLHVLLWGEEETDDEIAGAVH